MKRLALLACLLTVCITASSALIRHWQAGLGCDAWGACAATFPVRGGAEAAAGVPVEPPPAIRVARLTHRASASAVGLLVAAIALFGWARFSGAQRVASAIALADTVFLAWLGRYTPHDLPLVTVGNVAGGMVLAAVLAWLATADAGRAAPPVSRAVTSAPRAGGPAGFSLLLMALLVFTGTMTSVRGAVDACPQLLCLGGARLEAAAFDPWAAGDLERPAEIGMHLVHRLLALAFAAAALSAASRAWRSAAASERGLAVAIAVLVATQLALGLATGFGAAPLVTATLHNAVAALLASVLTALAAAAPRATAAPRLMAAADPDRFAGT